MKKHLLKKIHDKSAVIGIIGMGYVGIPLFLRFAAEGYKVIGFDIDKEKVEMLNRGESYIKHVKSRDIKQAITNGFESSFNLEKIFDVDAVILCLPTPLNEDNSPDLSYIINSMDAIKPYLRKGQLISLESTTYPGTTEEELYPRIQEMGLQTGENFFLSYSPEREDPGNPDFNPKNIPKIVSGFSSNCLDIALALYGSVVDKVIPMSSLRTAEMTKLLENIYRAVNIGLINEMKMVADAMEIDIHEVISGAATKPFGFKPFFPGPGLGGHCIPIDPFYLTWKAKKVGVDSKFIELAGEVNTNMPLWVVSKIEKALNNINIDIQDSKILILGLAYKKNIDDVRESPAVELLSILAKKVNLVDYSDPYVKDFPKMRKYAFNKSSIDLTSTNLKKYDVVLLATDHDNFDYKLIEDSSNLIVDTRGVFLEPSTKIIKA
jgi:UDP-N-acetyl-D-glucosamine dehydrogenase|tara:strand:+ start:1648 stop:2952 length:1305 start_codon:yes stop_codon:yes gene_type:complete